MPVKPVPDTYHTVTPYLVVKGAARLVDFMKTAFGLNWRGVPPKRHGNGSR